MRRDSIDYLGTVIVIIAGLYILAQGVRYLLS